MKYIRKFESTNNNEEEYFFDQDESSHWYMIPVRLKNRWMELISRGEDDEEANDLIMREFGQYMTGGIQKIKFSNPKKI